MNELNRLEIEESEFSLFNLVEIVYRRRLVVLIAALVIFLVAIFIATRPSKFEAVGALRIEPGSSGRYSTSSVSALTAGAGDKVVSETEILQSRTVYLRVARELNLASDPAFWGVARLPARSLDDPKWRDLTLARMHRKIRVDHNPKDEIVRVYAETTSPELSAKIVNTVINDYIENLFRMRAGANHRVADWLLTQLDDLKRQIESDQKSLIELQGKLGIIGLDDKSNNYLPAETLDQLTKASTDATIQRIVSEAKYRFLSETTPGLIEGEQPLLNGNSSETQGLLQTLRNSQATAAAEYARLSAQFGPNYPDVKQAKAQLESDRAQVKAEEARIVNQARLAYNAAKANEDLTNGMVSKQRSDVSRTKDDMARYATLLHDYQGHRSLYEGLVQRLREAGITSGLESGEIDIVDLADAPYFPSSLSPWITLLGGVLVSILFGCFVALVLEVFDTKVSTSEQAEKISRLPLLGLVPKLSTINQRDSMSHHLPEVASAPRSHYAESMQSLRNSLLMMTRRGSTARIILITSSLPGEGKSTTSRNLAFTFSLHNTRTLLIDCDLRRGRVAHALNVLNTVGLSDVLTGRSALEDAIVPIAGADKLFVLPTGAYPPQAAVLVSSQAMVDLLEQCRDQYDCVILDCPPLIGLTDALTLCDFADVVLVVVREEYTQKRALQAAVKSLASIPDKAIGFAMNGVSEGSQGYGYGGYYHVYYDDSNQGAKS
jgi:capsular exopolysaccharide synthesis family protein